MKKAALLVLINFLTSFIPCARADEGMWIPMLIEKYNIRLMHEKGFRLSAEDIYSVNRACMKDAVVLFGGGCTGEIISPEGLLITNHHCGYDQIQSHSTLEHDYLTNGFWAMSQEEELPGPGLTVKFLRRMEEVTGKALKGTGDMRGGPLYEKMISENIAEIEKNAIAGTNFTASVRPFYMGNQYFLLVYETFTDVRLVGAPPSSIGKFGGETDNWIWPRHTGDFSLFRVYAGKDNKPAGYSKDNVPYKPVYYFPVSLKGYSEGDFTMVFGYPGTTVEYVPSFYIDMVKNYINPKMIALRTIKIELMDKAMNNDPLVRIQYSAKKSGIANSWKKWIGENQGLEKMKTIENKKNFEESLSAWIDSDTARKKKYGNIINTYRTLYNDIRKYILVNTYTNDVFFNSGAEAVGFALKVKTLAELLQKKAAGTEIENVKKNLLLAGQQFYRNYNRTLDMELFTSLMTMYGENIDRAWQAPEYIELHRKCNGDFASLAGRLYKRSSFTGEEKFISLVDGLTRENSGKLTKDPFYKLAVSVSGFLSYRIRPELDSLNGEIRSLNREYLAAQMEFDKERLFYPDANSTLRVAYGKIKGYNAKDAVWYCHYTTLKGIMEKDNPDVYDYDVPDRLRKLYEAKDYGRYARDGEVPVCFIADNHTTGGNSGSPVLNAYGHLIGVNFDRVWEGVASDMAFNPDQSRNISLDIRYALFIIDRFAGAGYLLNEMTLIE
jgi:hypothetical protein